MHTPLCRHANGEPVDYAAHAQKVGLQEIGFTDHSPMQVDDFDDWRMLASELDLYIEKVEVAAKKFPDLTIKIGLEVDYIPGHEEWITELKNKHSWDYFIGSVHYISNDWAIDNPEMISKWKSRDPYAVWKIYFERLSQAATSGFFDIIGHVDLCKKFAIYPKENIDSSIEEFLNTAKNNDVAIELNTAGLRKDCREIYPSHSILKKAQKLGIPITFGSDAHKPEEVGQDFDQAIALAKSVGYSQSCIFSQGKRTFAPLL